MSKKIFKIAVPAIAVLLAAGFFLSRAGQKKNPEPIAVSSVRVAAESNAVGISKIATKPKTTVAQDGVFRLDIYSNGEKKSYEAEADGKENLFDLLKKEMMRAGTEFVYQEYPGLGVMIKQIGDKQNGEDGKYWQFWVNGKFAAVGAGEYVVKPGDVVEWRFIKENGAD